MIKAIIFDFWGTLAENGTRSPTKQIQERLNIEVPFPEYVVRMETALMTEKFADLNEAFNNLAQEFGIELDETKREELVGLWNKNWMLAKPYVEVETQLAHLKTKYRLFLASNTDNFSVPHVLEKFKLTPYFEKIFYSYQLHLIKTDKNFFKAILDDLNLAPEECIFVGDSIQSDIIPAKRIGMEAVLIDRRATRDFVPKISNLNELERFLK